MSNELILCDIICRYLCGSEPLEKIDGDAKMMLDEVGFEWK